MTNLFSALSITLGVIVMISIVKDYLNDKAEADKQERARRRAILRRWYEQEDELFRMQLAREQGFRDAARGAE